MTAPAAAIAGSWVCSRMVQGQQHHQQHGPAAWFPSNALSISWETVLHSHLGVQQ
jgi:hypothetical protein